MSALTGIRVVELAESVAGEYCGKLLADFGAEVVKVEAPGRGSPTRALRPRVGDTGAVFGYLNTNKRSVALDRSDTAALHALLATADAVIDDHDPQWAAEVWREHPDAVVCSITPYGAGAPANRQNAYSLNVFHSSGWGFHTPSHADPARPPLKGPGRFLADYEAGLDAALCVAACLYAQGRSGAGQFVDISQQAVLVSRADCILGRFVTGEVDPQNTRDDFDQQGPASFFACADGFVYLYLTSRAHWAAVKELMGRPEWLDDFADDWLEFSVTREKVAAFHRGFADWIREQSREEAAERAQRAGVPLVPVNDAADLRRSPQYHHRRYFATVADPAAGDVRYPTVPYRLSASPASLRSPAPALGADTADVLSTPRDRRTGAGQPAGGGRGGPLAGVRVVELTKVWAGPYAGKLLAFLGAEVIKVECRARPEEMRAYGGTDIDHAPYFLSINPEILSVDLDIKTPEGMSALRDLIAHSDVVINNLRPGAMERQGLGYDALRAIRRDIVSVSIKMWGNDGPLAHQTGYAPCFAALAGAAALVGYEGGPPLGPSMRYGDSTVGAAAAYATVAALLHRQRTGDGQFVDVSAVEVLSSMIGDTLFAHELTGRPPVPDGNRHADMSPHGCYPCAGGDWVSIAVPGDTTWQALCAALDAPALAADLRFRTAAARQRAADAVDAEMSSRTATFEVSDLVRRLQAAGVPAAKSATAVDVLGDALLWERGTFCFVSDHREGQRPVLGPSWRLSRDPARIEHGAPNLGEHNDYVFEGILGGRRMAAT
ncbi:CoA transferase [Mycobacterium sp. PS03-16]|uniref:CaiB/BaiF CoA transferase family protein n=1 Tax=Mycobacterium sp. PS03-16 TaxID=2559611 RepID=UPI00107416C5|nr:CoA transferase [Mycobacterium sp. PS03-16]TFV55887.1 CoA transferase [Mycobacterium sp. PS03-16]